MISEKMFKIIRAEESLSYVSLHRINQSIQSGTMYAIQKQKQNIGFIEICCFTRSWIGIFSFYIKNNYRNRRIGTKIMQTLLNHFSEFNVYLATNSPYMIKICNTLGFTVVKLRELPPIIIIKLAIKRIRSIGNAVKLVKMQRNRSLGIYCLLKTF